MTLAIGAALILFGSGAFFGLVKFRRVEVALSESSETRRHLEQLLAASEEENGSLAKRVNALESGDRDCVTKLLAFEFRRTGSGKKHPLPQRSMHRVAQVR